MGMLTLRKTSSGRAARGETQIKGRSGPFPQRALKSKRSLDQIQFRETKGREVEGSYNLDLNMFIKLLL